MSDITAPGCDGLDVSCLWRVGLTKGVKVPCKISNYWLLKKDCSWRSFSRFSLTDICSRVVMYRALIQFDVSEIVTMLAGMRPADYVLYAPDVRSRFTADG